MEKLGLRDLGFNVGPEAAVRVTLRRLHLPEPALVRLEHLDLVRDRYLCVHDNGKIKRGKLAQQTGKGRVGKFLQTDYRIQQPSDVQVRVRLVETQISQLLSGTAILKKILSGGVRPSVRLQRIERPLGFEEQLLLVQPVRSELRRLHRGLDPNQQGLELRHQALVFLAGALNGGPG